MQKSSTALSIFSPDTQKSVGRMDPEEKKPGQKIERLLSLPRGGKYTYMTSYRGGHGHSHMVQGSCDGLSFRPPHGGLHGNSV